MQKMVKDTRRLDHGEPPATCNVQRATCNVQHATCECDVRPIGSDYEPRSTWHVSTWHVAREHVLTLRLAPRPPCLKEVDYVQLTPRRRPDPGGGAWIRCSRA